MFPGYLFREAKAEMISEFHMHCGPNSPTLGRKVE